jgi:hypothetical protein
MSVTLLKVLKHPGLNLAINVFMMLFQFVMAANQYLQGDITAAFTFLISGFSCSTAVIYWILIWWASKK